jgi:hypothetical protein
MKKIITICAALILAASVFAQAPQKMSYQAVIRNNQNALVSNQAVGMRISILQGSATGTAVYVETQTPTTNINGLASIEIGGGTIVNGTFASINWANGPYFVKTETDPAGGTSYSITGTSQLLSVPYALHAKNTDSWSVNSDTTYTLKQVNIGNNSSSGLMTYNTYPLNIMGTNVINAANDSRIGITRVDNTAGSPAIVFHKARGSSFSMLNTTNLNDGIGVIGFTGFNGNTFADPSSAIIGASAAENFSSTAQGTNLEFRTTSKGTSGLPPIRFKIRSEGSVIFVPLNSAPASPTKGETYFDNTLNKLRVYDGTTWQNCW